jgi:hypothetical protein
LSLTQIYGLAEVAKIRLDIYLDYN